MATKQFTRTVEAINTLLDKIDGYPIRPMAKRGTIMNPSYLPEEATEGDVYLVLYSDSENTQTANALYYKTASNWEIIATKSYTQYEIDNYLEGKQDTASITTVQYTATQANTYELVTGLTYNLPAGETALITATAINQNGAISGIKISTSSTLSDSSTIAVSESTSSYRALSCSCAYTAGSSSETLYVFVEYDSAVENDVTLCVQ